MLRQSDDKREASAEAFAHEISHISEVDMPEQHKDEINAVFDKLSLPQNVETVSRMGHPHEMVKHVTEDEVQELVETTYYLEKVLQDSSV